MNPVVGIGKYDVRRVPIEERVRAVDVELARRAYFLPPGK
jgi:hypothetical protein